VIKQLQEVCIKANENCRIEILVPLQWLLVTIKRSSVLLASADQWSPFALRSNQQGNGR